MRGRRGVENEPDPIFRPLNFPFKTLATTLLTHLRGIVEHFRSGMSNGFIEAMNGQIQAAKARAKGYATATNMTTIAYLLCAKLKHLPRNPWLPEPTS
ncbi:MAG: transposase [Pseudomonadota bacterium]|nr:transposase [Pseudomonadota bacterium]